MPSWSCCCCCCWKLPGKTWCICWFKWLWLKWLWWWLYAPLDAEKLLWWWWLPNGWWCIQLHSCSHDDVVAKWNCWCCCCWSSSRRDKRFGPQPRYEIVSIDDGSVDVILSLPAFFRPKNDKITNHRARVNKLGMMSRMWFPALEKSSSCFYLLDIYGPSLIRSEQNEKAMNSLEPGLKRKGENKKVNLNVFLLFPMYHSRVHFEFREFLSDELHCSQAKRLLPCITLHKPSTTAPAYESAYKKDEMSSEKKWIRCRKLKNANFILFSSVPKKNWARAEWKLHCGEAALLQIIFRRKELL